MTDLKMQMLVVGDLQVNCYILYTGMEQGAIVIDPGDEAERIAAECESLGKTIEFIFLTHAHCDHIGAVEELRKMYPGAKLVAHKDEVPLLQQSTLNLSWFLNKPIKVEVPEIILGDETAIELGEWNFNAYHIPGHSPGGTAYCFKGIVNQSLLFPGDILFSGSIGRTDFPDGCYETLIAGIKTHLLTLPHETIVYPGHGPSTTIGDEIAENPFLQGL